MEERARSPRDGPEDALRHQCRADRLIPGAQPLGDNGYVGDDALLLTGEQRSRSSHPRHHFVENHKHAVPVANFADAPEVARDRRYRAKGRSDDGLRDEGRNRLGAKTPDGPIEIVRDPLAVSVLGFAVLTLAIRLARRDLRRRHEDRIVDLPARGVPPDTERAERVAVIAVAAGDETVPLRLSGFDEILARDLERRLHRLRPTADEVDVRKIARSRLDEMRGKFLLHGGREEGRVRVGQIIELADDRRPYIGIRMTERRHGSTGGGVDVHAPVRIDDANSLATNRHGRCRPEVTVDHAAQDRPASAPAPPRTWRGCQ